MSDSRFSLGIQFNDVDELEVFAIDGEDGPDDTAATFMALLNEWITDQAIDGELRPFRDDSLDMLAMLAYAQRIIVACFTPDDPHIPDIIRALDTMAEMLERLKSSLR